MCGKKDLNYWTQEALGRERFNQSLGNTEDFGTAAMSDVDINELLGPGYRGERIMTDFFLITTVQQ